MLGYGIELWHLATSGMKLISAFCVERILSIEKYRTSQVFLRKISQDRKHVFDGGFKDQPRWTFDGPQAFGPLGRDADFAPNVHDFKG